MSARSRRAAGVQAAGLLLAGALAAQQPTAAAAPTEQAAPTAAPVAEDWARAVERACTSPRFGLRLAASKKVAAGGDAAVPAIRAFVAQHGQDALPVALVEALADGGGAGAQVLRLLEGWAGDREFYWRAQAMRGLALRTTGGPFVPPRSEQLFAQGAGDPAWLLRTYARAGAARSAAFEPGYAHIDCSDADPRAATRLAATLCDLFTAPPAATVLAASLGDERTFLGDPWGKRRATEALQALQRIHGKDWGYRPAAGYEANRGALDAMAHDLDTELPAHLVDAEVPFTGGLEILSCRNGDLFVRWTDDGRLAIDTTPVCDQLVQVPTGTWQRLSAAATALNLPPQSGVVICDKMRILLGTGRAQAAVATAALPPEAADWLKQLAAAIEEAGEPPLAGALRDRLSQFVVR